MLSVRLPILLVVFRVRTFVNGSKPPLETSTNRTHCAIVSRVGTPFHPLFPTCFPLKVSELAVNPILQQSLAHMADKHPSVFAKSLPVWLNERIDHCGNLFYPHFLVVQSQICMLEVRKRSSSRATGLDEQSWAAEVMPTDGHPSWYLVTRHGQACKALSMQTSYLV